MNIYKEKSKQAFDKQAKEYDNAMYGEHARKLYPALLEVICHSYGNTVLDIGCGTGALLKQVYDEDHRRILYGIDISTKMVQKSKERMQDKATIIEGDSEHLPFKDNTFDIVYCNDSFHHYPNPDKVLEQMQRVVKVGGICIIGECYLPIILRQAMNVMMKYSNEGDVKIYSKKQWQRMMKKYFHAIVFKKIDNKSCLIYGYK